MNNIKCTCGATLQDNSIAYKYTSCPVTFDYFHIYVRCHNCGAFHELKEQHSKDDVDFAMKRLEQEIHKLPAVPELKPFRYFLDGFMQFYINQTFQVTIESFTNEKHRKRKLSDKDTEKIIIYNRVFEFVKECLQINSDEKVIKKGKVFFSKYPLEACYESINEISKELHIMVISDKDLKANADTVFDISRFLSSLYLKCYHSVTV